MKNEINQIKRKRLSMGEKFVRNGIYVINKITINYVI